MITSKTTRFLAFITMLLCQLQLFAQADTVDVPYKELLNYPEEFSAHLDVGVGWMPNSYADENEHLNVSNRPAFNLGLAWVHHYKKPLFLRMELMVMNIQSQEIMDAHSYTTDSGSVVSDPGGKVSKSATYFTVPLIFGLDLSVFYLGAGLQGGFLVNGTGYTYHRENFTEITRKENVYADADAGFRLLTGVRFAQHFYAEASYYHGLGNICSGRLDTYGQNWNARQLTIGIRYSFHYYQPFETVDLFDLENLD